MYSKCKGFGAAVVPVFVLFLCTSTARSAFAVGGTRDLSGGCGPGAAVTVSIAVEPPDGTLSQALEDSPPAGWTDIDNISDGGVYDSQNHKVKWGPFFDDSPRTVSYDVTPPGGATGGQCFEGTASFDGHDQVIAGLACVAEVSPACWRVIPAVSQWGMIAMTLLVLTAGTLILARRHQAQAIVVGTEVYSPRPAP